MTTNTSPEYSRPPHPPLGTRLEGLHPHGLFVLVQSEPGVWHLRHRATGGICGLCVVGTSPDHPMAAVFNLGAEPGRGYGRLMLRVLTRHYGLLRSSPDGNTSPEARAAWEAVGGRRTQPGEAGGSRYWLSAADCRSFPPDARRANPIALLVEGIQSWDYKGLRLQRVSPGQDRWHITLPAQPGWVHSVQGPLYFESADDNFQLVVDGNSFVPAQGADPVETQFSLEHALERLRGPAVHIASQVLRPLAEMG